MAVRKDLFDDENIVKQEDNTSKAFTVEGLKKFQYIGDNLILVTEAGTKVNYTIEWLFLKGVLPSLRFNDRQVDIALKTLLNYLEVVLDFNNSKVFIPESKRRTKPVIQSLIRAIKEYDPETKRVFGDNPEEDIKEWHQVL